MINRIDAKFSLLKKQARTAFMPFCVAGDPDFKTSLKIAETLCKAGDLLEIGIPYSDPLADGPTIQAAGTRALQAGITPDSVFRLIKQLRKSCNTPILILVYANMILKRGIEKFYFDTAKSGADGIIVPDAPVEESDEFLRAARKYNLKQIFLAAQTTADLRLKMILKRAQGFLYLVSVLGVTGVRKKFDDETKKFIRRVKKQTDLPLCVGFGISNPVQFKQMARYGADGVIAGSAIVDIIAKNSSKKSMFKALKQFTNSFSNSSTSAKASADR